MSVKEEKSYISSVQGGKDRRQKGAKFC